MTSLVSNNLEQRTRRGIAGTSQFQRELVALIPFLRAMSGMRCRNRAMAEDIAQDTLAKAWRARDSFEPGTNLKAWLFTILRNEFLSQQRRAWREVAWDPALGEQIAVPAHEQEWAVELSDTARALGELPECQRDALILVAAGGFTYKDAAEICGTPEGTVKSRLARGRTALLEILDGSAKLPRRASLRAINAADDILGQLSALAGREVPRDYIAYA